MGVTLVDFATTARARVAASRATPCRACNLPSDLKAQLDAGRASNPPVSFELISVWLKGAHGLMISRTALQRHYWAHVNKRGGTE